MQAPGPCGGDEEAAVPRTAMFSVGLQAVGLELWVCVCLCVNECICVYVCLFHSATLLATKKSKKCL